MTGGIGLIEHGGTSVFYAPMPTKKCLNYTKAKQITTRIKRESLLALLKPISKDSVCFIERPMINPMRWKASVSAIRALECTQGVLEELQIRYEFKDSKEWQKVLLPSGLAGEELKFASLEVGKRLFPRLDFSQFKDADGLLIAEYCRRMHML